MLVVTVKESFGTLEKLPLRQRHGLVVKRKRLC